jgi:hypothetical protein
VQVTNIDGGFELFASSLYKQLDLASNARVQNIVQADELCEELVVDLDQNITLLNLAVGRTLGQNNLSDQHTSLFGELCADLGFTLRSQAKSAALIKWLDKELCLNASS